MENKTGEVKAISEKNQSVNIDEAWFNVADNVKMNFIKKGKCEYQMQGDEIIFIKSLSSNSPNQSKGTTWEDDIVNFETLLTAAHKEGLKEIRTEMLNVDIEKKYALFKAVAVGKIGSFEGHGDATSENVTGDFIKPHFIRMAETRAIVRALRWYTNNAKCSEEEKAESKIPEESFL